MHAWQINCLRQHASSGSASRGMVQHGTAVLLVEKVYLEPPGKHILSINTARCIKVAKSLRATIQ